MTPTRNRPSGRPGKGSPATRNRNRNSSVSAARRAGNTSMSPRAKVVIAVVAVAVLAAFAVALIAGGGDDSGSDDTATTGNGGSTPADNDNGAAPGTGAAAVSVEGVPLVPLPESGEDPAVGEPMPAISGTSLEGEPLTVGGSDGAEMIVFLAHWCPHCQAEVPVIQEWVDEGNLPEGVDLTAVATANDSRRPNYPASEWLDEEGWSAPTLLDDAENTAAQAAGVSSFPFMVFVDEDGNVASRAAGELGPDELSTHVEDLVEES